MIRDICKDEAFLAQKAETATAEDLDPAQDLLKHSERDFLKGRFSVMGASTRPKMSPS